MSDNYAIVLNYMVAFRDSTMYQEVQYIIHTQTTIVIYEVNCKVLIDVIAIFLE